MSKYVGRYHYDWHKYWKKHPCVDCGKPVGMQYQRCNQCAPKHTALTNESWRTNIAAARKGLKASPETRATMSASQKLRQSIPGNRERHAAAYTPEIRAKMSEIAKRDAVGRSARMKERNQSLEFRQKVIEGVKRSYSDPESKANRLAAHRTPETKRLLSEAQKASWALGHREAVVGLFREKYRKGIRSAIEARTERALIALGEAYYFEHKVGRYFVDFALPERMWIIECDWPICAGKDWHQHCEHSQRRDKKRDEFLSGQQWTVFHLKHTTLTTDEKALAIVSELLGGTHGC